MPAKKKSTKSTTPKVYQELVAVYPTSEQAKRKAEKLRADGHEVKMGRTIKDLPSRYGTGTHGVFRVVRRK